MVSKIEKGDENMKWETNIGIKKEINRETNREMSKETNREINREVNRDVNRRINIEVNREISRKENREVNKMRKLTCREIEKFVNIEGVEKEAVENFLATMGRNRSIEIKNLVRDRDEYKWNSITVRAILLGMDKARPIRISK